MGSHARETELTKVAADLNALAERTSDPVEFALMAQRYLDAVGFPGKVIARCDGDWRVIVPTS